MKIESGVDGAESKIVPLTISEGIIAWALNFIVDISENCTGGSSVGQGDGPLERRGGEYVVIETGDSVACSKSGTKGLS